jgi:8-amino-3,8-dideoxy-alpha-D-manno-octulosonate transaminase
MYITNEEDARLVSDLILTKKYSRNRGKDSVGHCRQFELDFAKTMGTSHALMVTSGTNALICALLSLNLEAGDEVIIPCFTFFATAVAVIHSKATPVIVNIDSSLMIDPEEVERAITPKTKAIIAVHMDGHACNMNALKKIADSHNLKLIEDVAQACGGSFQNKRLGSIGDIGCFSFNTDKILSCGEGGAVIMNDDGYFQSSLCVQDACCSFGPTFKDAFTKISPFVGQSMRVSEISGALMQLQLSRLDFILENLRARKKIIFEILKKHNIELVASHDEEGDCATSFYLRFDSPAKANQYLLNFAENKIAAVSINMRPAHASWQWGHLLEKERPEGKYKKVNFLSSIDLLMSTLKINIPFEISLEETHEFGKKIVSVLHG